MLLAGDKAGNWSQWYSKNIPIADNLLTEHQDQLRKQRHQTPKTRKGQKRR